MKIALYTRVSTDQQDATNQRFRLASRWRWFLSQEFKQLRETDPSAVV